MFFSVAKRLAIKEANPDATFGDIGKLVGVAWKELSDAEKAKWDERARQDKDRYRKEMDDYSAPSDDDDDDDSDGGKDKGKPKAKPKAKKDPNEPKKPMNAYMLYSNSVRARVREENPGLSLGDVAKEIASRYKTISADEKAGWQAKSDAAKEVYKKEMAKYDLTRPPETKAKKNPASAAAAVKKKSTDKEEGKKKKPEPEPESSEESDDSESESDDSDDSDSGSD